MYELRKKYMYKWNNDWRDEYKETDPQGFERFADCRATKLDLIKMTSLLWKYNPTMSKDACFEYMCEWLCANGQYFVLNITNYKWYLDRVKK